MKATQITLFGDSIIDNGVYVGSEELSVLQHLSNADLTEFSNSVLSMVTRRLMFCRTS